MVFFLCFVFYTVIFQFLCVFSFIVLSNSVCNTSFKRFQCSFVITDKDKCNSSSVFFCKGDLRLLNSMRLVLLKDILH